MNCQSCRIEIEELEMSESLSHEARAHIGACSPCGAFYNERLSLRKLVGSLGPVSAPPDFEFRLRARLASNGSAGNHRFSLRSFIASSPAIGVAASFALLIAAVVLYNHFKPGAAATDQSGTIASQTSERKADETDRNPVSEPAISKTLPGVSEPQKQENTSSGAVAVNVNSPRQRLSVNNKNLARQQRPSNTNNTQIVSNDAASLPAPQITPDGSSPLVAAPNPLVELPVRSSSQAVRVFVDDRSGVRRSVTLEPVIFGSQDFTGRNSSRVQTPQGIW